MNKEMKLDRVEAFLKKLDTENMDSGIIETDDKLLELAVSGWNISVEILGVYIRGGVVCRLNEEKTLHMPDEMCWLFSENEEIVDGSDITVIMSDFITAIDMYAKELNKEINIKKCMCTVNV